MRPVEAAIYGLRNFYLHRRSVDEGEEEFRASHLKVLDDAIFYNVGKLAV